MKIKATILALLATALVNSAFAAEGPVPKGVTDLDHVFLIMMENHGYRQIINNPSAPFINQLANSSGYATNYFAIGHPSSTNYLEIVGGSNFGVRSDDYPNWHSTCMPNLATGVTTFDKPTSSPALVCPIWGTGIDAATPAIDCTNEVQTTPPNCYIDITKTSVDIPAAPNTIGKTIADQLVERGRSWKSYQENLPPGGADGVNYSDGFFTNNTDFTPFLTTPSSFTSWTVQGVTVPPVMTQKDANGDIVLLYAAKHNPFAYFRDVQEGINPRNSLKNIVGFESLYQDLGSGDVPDFSFIVPNQCNDQHGRGNAGPFCNFDENDNDTQTGLNEALILQGDVTVQRIVTAIKSSDAWKRGKNAIVVVWDENDYTATPNQVLLIVDTNYGDHGVKSSTFYTHFSLLRSLESGFDLPCLNHACDAGVNVMTDLFAK
jgi:phosphatidylinositol-3-phosphatase